MLQINISDNIKYYEYYTIFIKKYIIYKYIIFIKNFINLIDFKSVNL